MLLLHQQPADQCLQHPTLLEHLSLLWNMVDFCRGHDGFEEYLITCKDPAICTWQQQETDALNKLS